MKTQIRRGVFETNSSSVHSISITKDGFNDSLPSKFTIAHNGEFGWEVDYYDSPMDKAAYLYQAIVCYPTYNYYTKEEYDMDTAKEMLQGLMNKFIGNIESYGIKVDCKYRFANTYYSEYTDNDKRYSYWYVYFVDENGNESEDKGYLDHGGEAKEFVDYVLSSPENTVKFIFDNRCYIETGNDNDDDYWDKEKDNDEESIIFEKGN